LKSTIADQGQSMRLEERSKPVIFGRSSAPKMPKICGAAAELNQWQATIF
jgi:hypothetical protein